jgi:hypothetical protein
MPLMLVLYVMHPKILAPTVQAMFVATDRAAAINLWMTQQQASSMGQTCRGELYAVDLEKLALKKVAIPEFKWGG